MIPTGSRNKAQGCPRCVRETLGRGVRTHPTLPRKHTTRVTPGFRFAHGDNPRTSLKNAPFAVLFGSTTRVRMLQFPGQRGAVQLDLIAWRASLSGSEPQAERFPARARGFSPEAPSSQPGQFAALVLATTVACGRNSLLIHGLPSILAACFLGRVGFFPPAARGFPHTTRATRALLRNAFGVENCQ